VRADGVLFELSLGLSAGRSIAKEKTVRIKLPPLLTSGAAGGAYDLRIGISGVAIAFGCRRCVLFWGGGGPPPPLPDFANAF